MPPEVGYLARASDQFDVVFDGETIRMPRDHPELVRVLEHLHYDKYMCFKMRWYVARHLRVYHEPIQAQCSMPYEAKIRKDHTSAPKYDGQHSSRDTLIRLKNKPFNRLDFEATRASHSFIRDEPNWEKTRLTQMLQMAYEEHGWDQVVDEDSVDDVLRKAGADLSLFDNAERMDDTMKFKFFAEEFGKMQKEGRSQSEDRSQIDRA
ncbi:hypothetical protein SUNI508_07719 [Seiridium unicorne]|uniref:Uncharacterized protein n=1 Tax=Seiridium unicorne TaxID=138068 RepID=A0ABR2UVI8_9PEZI